MITTKMHSDTLKFILGGSIHFLKRAKSVSGGGGNFNLGPNPKSRHFLFLKASLRTDLIKLREPWTMFTATNSKNQGLSVTFCHEYRQMTLFYINLNLKDVSDIIFLTLNSLKKKKKLGKTNGLFNWAPVLVRQFSYGTQKYILTPPP